MQSTMTVPLTCTINTLCHVDYHIPISIYKSTDYRTSTGTYHRFMPPPSQDFNTRVQASINPKLLESEPKQREEHYKSIYMLGYAAKQGDSLGYVPRPIPLQNVDFLRSVQEKMFKEPPPPISSGISETKREFYGKDFMQGGREAYPPNNFACCEIKALGRDEQPTIRPEHNGCYRHMDPYVTTNRITHLPFTIDQQDGLSRKDIITFYDASGFPRGGKGYGPKNCTEVKPIFRTQIGEMVDKTVFKTKAYNKLLPRFMKRIPNYGMQSEYQGKYTKQTYYDSFPTIHSTLEDYDESLPKAGPWQTLISPGMYCTDYCHIGSGWPVRAVVEPKKPEKYIEKNIDLCRNEQFVNREPFTANA